jgi:hypothetical protein
MLRIALLRLAKRRKQPERYVPFFLISLKKKFIGT